MTAAQVRSMVQAVVENDPTHKTFYPVWTEVKDRLSECTFPCVWWRQYTGRLLRDNNGWYRTQLVSLWVMTSVATNRTPVQLQEAVEAADKAAARYILKLEMDHGYEPDNVTLTTMADEDTQLLSGVVLHFTVKGDYMCLTSEDYPEPEA